MQISTTFQIKAFQPQHTCPRDPSSKLVDSTYLANEYLDDLRDNPKWDVLAMQKKFQRELGVTVSLHACYRAKRKAKQIIEGNQVEQYRCLFDYAETIRKTNPGSMLKIKSESVPKELYDVGVYGVERSMEGSSIPASIHVFEHLYVRFGAQK